jgi:hypothetical protein
MRARAPAARAPNVTHANNGAACRTHHACCGAPRARALYASSLGCRTAAGAVPAQTGARIIISVVMKKMMPNKNARANSPWRAHVRRTLPDSTPWCHIRAPEAARRATRHCLRLHQIERRAVDDPNCSSSSSSARAFRRHTARACARDCVCARLRVRAIARGGVARPPHTHTRAHTRARTIAPTHAHTYTRTHVHAHARTRTRARAHAHTNHSRAHERQRRAAHSSSKKPTAPPPPPPPRATGTCTWQ